MKITIHKINSASPRLSDEEPDLLEQEDLEALVKSSSDGWLPWNQDDLIDIKNIIEIRMPMKQRMIIEAFLLGQTCHEIGVTEKYWRYHYQKAVEFIKKELKL